ncbi:peptide ABC transporter substrate-binding protein [Campylobacter concisus]|uniref:ABC transporter substrate-binding protein n=1 Tax=Campylobacter concisus TaxID=199 RepID=UPI000B3D5517|nr:ABC transporter substrate-binding protein [Campylobacter concisus]OUT15945.1 peptide ABC transporter substrate-binding protein [Campylobacter concisus]
MKKFFMALVVLFASLLLNAAEFRDVKDITGDVVKVPAKVEKIATLWYANNQIILMLGGADKIVATTDLIKNNKWFAHVYPRISSIPNGVNGKDLQVEELVKLSPDVVIAADKKNKEELTKNGFTVLYPSFTNHADMKKSVSIMAEVIGGEAPKIAQKFNEYFDGNLKRVLSKTDKIAASDRPKVLHIADGKNLFKVDGTNTIIDEWIRVAGGQNAVQKAGNMLEINAEEMPNMNPDVIIIGRAKAPEILKKIYENPIYADTNAVKNKRVYVNPTGVFSWDRYGAEGALQILWAAKILHPEIFKDIDIAAETKKFYKEFLHYELSDDEVNYILNGLDPTGK